MSAHSKMISDRYLHFPTNMTRSNEFLSFVVNASSDTEDESENDEDLDEEQRNSKSSLKDWMIVKAEAANIRLNNDFTPLLSPTSYRRRSNRNSSERENGWYTCTNDAYSLANRTFELTSFEQILREYKNSRVLAVDDLNQCLQSSSFMKIFKSPEPAKKMSISQVTATNMSQKADGTQDGPIVVATMTNMTTSIKSTSTEEDDEDDDDDEGAGSSAQTAVEDFIQIDEDRNSKPAKIFDWINEGSKKTKTEIKETLRLSSGLKSSQEAYKFEFREPSEQDMAMYRKYASIVPGVKKPESSETEGHKQSTVRSFCQLGPMFEFSPSFFTIDSAFHTEINGVSKASLAIYEKTCSVDGGSMKTSTSTAKLYSEHESIGPPNDLIQYETSKRASRHDERADIIKHIRIAIDPFSNDREFLANRLHPSYQTARDMSGSGHLLRAGPLKKLTPFGLIYDSFLRGTEEMVLSQNDVSADGDWTICKPGVQDKNIGFYPSCANPFQRTNCAYDCVDNHKYLNGYCDWMRCICTCGLH
ncbi:hypothetical protein DdX_18642 [Ditylenchus destructor]|uniref:Uncharacterized protein n=1 Tax=Ditylenchus destructor TaxID=166010 RepID=A0AAD4QUQ4_9BILA|nr:hypothetical protein DdX_18642 [Ditylenchus destructor]